MKRFSISLLPIQPFLLLPPPVGKPSFDKSPIATITDTTTMARISNTTNPGPTYVTHTHAHKYIHNDIYQQSSTN
jgi:hypothetical protein